MPESSRLGFTVFVDFQDEGADFWIPVVERRFRISTTDANAMEPFFAHVYNYVSQMISDGTKGDGKLPNRPIGFIGVR